MFSADRSGAETATYEQINDLSLKMSVFVWEGGNKTMPNMNYPESDWKLFRSKISDWQEAYMEKLCKEYIDILSADGSSADRFWAVEERIKGDRKKVGVQAEIRRSQMFYNIVSLIREGAISLEDLDGFSEELKQAAEASMNW